MTKILPDLIFKIPLGYKMMIQVMKVKGQDYVTCRSKVRSNIKVTRPDCFLLCLRFGLFLNIQSSGFPYDSSGFPYMYDSLVFPYAAIGISPMTS